MKKAVTAFVPLFVFAMAMSAFAQGAKIDTNAQNTETVKVTVSGGLDVDWIWRDRAFNAATGLNVGTVTGNFTDEGFFVGHYNVQLDIDLSEKVKILLRIDNPSLPRTAAVTGGGNVLGTNPEGMTAQVRQANITFNELFDPAVSLSVGTNEATFDIRGNGSPLFWDPAHSGSIYGNVAGALPLGNGSSTSTADELQPTGVVFSYNRESIHLNVILAPAIIERGASKADESGGAVTLLYDLTGGSMGKGSRLGAIVALTSGAGSGAMYTVGGGATVRDLGMKGLELFGEFYFQAGEVTLDTDAGGFALEIGAKLMFEHDLQPWVEAKLTMQTGDDDQTAGDQDVDAFLSYEHHDDLMILQSDFYGADWDTNFFGIIISGGVALNVGQGKNNLRVWGVIGLCRTMEDVAFGATNEDALGNEVDIRAAYDFSKQVTIDAGIAMLFGSDILELSGGGSADPDADDSSFLFTWGVSGKF
jgi:hypothetical protein